MIKREAQAHIIYQDDGHHRADMILVFFDDWVFGFTTPRIVNYRGVPDRQIVGEIAGSIFSRGPTGNTLNQFLCDLDLGEMIK